MAMTAKEKAELKKQMLAENLRRLTTLRAEYDPITGKDAPGQRVHIVIEDYAVKEQWIPVEMWQKSKMVRDIVEAGSISKYIETHRWRSGLPSYHAIEEEFRRVRHKYDFTNWAYWCIWIKTKKKGMARFILNLPQLLVLAECERQRRLGGEINIIIVKARQWGGSTFSIFYQFWLAVHWDRHHSFVVAAHTNSASGNILRMLKRALERYPSWDLGLKAGIKLKLGTDSENRHCHYVEDQQGKIVLPAEIYIGSAKTPESLRGTDCRGAHYSEVCVWPDTPESRPENLIADINGGFVGVPYQMQVMESTAKTMDDYLHTVWMEAQDGKNNYVPIFIAFMQILNDTRKIQNVDKFLDWLIEHKDDDAPSGKWKDSGKHYWELWELGTTLEGINWYRYKRLEFTTYSQMANEAPKDSIEAFQAAGRHVFDMVDVNRMYKCNRPWVFEGELISKAREGAEVIEGIRFLKKAGGNVRIWEQPDKESPIENRYLVCVDIGGPNPTSDFHSVRVLDRFMMLPEFIKDGKPNIVAEMHYHCDRDLLAYDAARLAAYYNNALLVIESNTYETNDPNRDTEGANAEYILDILADFYPNLYARSGDPTKIKEGSPVEWGFHTNKKTKPQIIDNMKACLRDNLWDEPSKTCCDEMAAYIIDGKKMTAPAKKHDDVLMCTAILLWISYNDMDMPYWYDADKTRIHKRERTGSAAAM